MSVKHPETPGFITSMHIGSRVFAGISFILAAAVNQAIITALIQLGLFVALLLFLEQSTLSIRKSLKILGWLAVPILLLHALFTPGELLTSAMAIPVSIEGLRAGFWFTLHLAVLFFSAVLFSKLLTYREWLYALLHIPVAGRCLAPYVLLLEGLREEVGSLLRFEVAEWRKQGMGIKNFARKMGLILVQGLQQSRLYARRLWHDWDQQVAVMLVPEVDRKQTVLPTVTAITGGVLMCYFSFPAAI